MSIITKITVGFVSQSYDSETGKCITQEFVAGDQVSYEDEYGETVEPVQNEVPFHLDMVEPDSITTLS